MPVPIEVPYKKILITSGKGGVGKSTLAAAFAKAMVARGERVLLIDFDISLRTLDLMLNAGDKVLYDWGDIVRGDCEPLEAVVQGENGPDLLAAPLTVPPGCTEEKITEFVDRLAESYDTIILDSPAGVGHGFRAARATADSAILVSTPDRICVRSAAVAADKLLERGIPSRLLINRFNKRTVGRGRALTVDDVIDNTGLQLIGIVPEDPILVESAQNGEPLDPTSKGARAIERVLDRIGGEDVPLKL